MSVQTFAPILKEGKNHSATLLRACSRRFVDFKTNKSLGKIRDVKINCDGTRVAILSDTESTDSYSQQPNTKLHVYNADTHGITAHDFGPARFPAKVCWDCDEPKLVCVQTSKVRQAPTRRVRWISKLTSLDPRCFVHHGLLCNVDQVHGYRPPSKNDKNGGAGKDSDDALLSVEDESVVDDDDRSTLATLFATDSHGVLLQDSFSFNSDKLALASMCVPYIYFAQSSQSADGVVRLKSRMMKDFVGTSSHSLFFVLPPLRCLGKTCLCSLTLAPSSHCRPRYGG